MSVRSLRLPKVIPVLLLLGSFLSEAEAMQMRPSKLSVEYVYAPDGMLTGRTVNGQVQRFEYDKRGQLLAVKDSQGNDLERYVYDPAGNILSKTVHGKTTRFTYDAANQITSRTNPDGSVVQYRYDAAGRLIQEGTRAYVYGYQDKVEEIRENGKTVARFTYGLDGQLESMTRTDGREENFYWDGLALIGRGKSTFLNEPYVTGGNPIASDGKAMLNDMLGSTIGIRDGEKMTPVSMTTFGESSDPEAMYTGKPHVDGLGYAFLFRNYRAELGKWQTVDPLGYPDGWNQLAYVNNIIIAFIDPLGCFWESVTEIATGIIVGAGSGAGVGAIVGSVVPGVGTAAGAAAGAITGAISGAIASLSHGLANPPQSYAEALASGALDGLFSGTVAGMGPAGAGYTMAAGVVSGVLSAGVNSNWDNEAMFIGGILGGVYGWGGNAGNDALLNNVLSACGISVTNTVLGYMDLFNNFFPSNLNRARGLNE